MLSGKADSGMLMRDNGIGNDAANGKFSMNVGMWHVEPTFPVFKLDPMVQLHNREVPNGAAPQPRHTALGMNDRSKDEALQMEQLPQPWLLLVIVRLLLLHQLLRCLCPLVLIPISPRNHAGSSLDSKKFTVLPLPLRQRLSLPFRNPKQVVP